MKTLLTVLAMTALSLCAADATGKWTGTFTAVNDGGETREEPAFMVLKQEGSKITGTAGPTASEQFEITNGKVEGARLTFIVNPPQGEEPRAIHVEMTQEGEQMTGEFTRERQGQKQVAKLKLKREG